ncbi:energy-coupling factor ABC transporter ATP-binding protein [Aeromonas veronii]|uniref:energy-coupling factor ABC transporter ATP-binding protein n=1 Tax=Aeromonas veronii TaxID=654 RepID=UPI0029D7791E|nr:energy-coupling factor ABC transporter ATP-binding protein [Aeromonas veronii]MDX7876588.1 energy-coupling factor ABC transporter ATP-binding protein [Aeromonas veronii]
MISLQGLTIGHTAHPDHFQLGPLDIELKEGEWLAILGGNGAGKSLLAQLLAGGWSQLHLDTLAGEGVILGQPHDSGQLNHHAAVRQWVQQSPYLQFSGCCFSVADEVAFGPANLGLLPDEVNRRVSDAMALCHCKALAARHPLDLSGGEAQRVVLACALAMAPKLLILDQAFSRLTPAATQTMLRQIRRYSEESGCSVILLEQRLFPAAHFCERFLLLDHGRQLACGELGEVLPHLPGRVILTDSLRETLQVRDPRHHPYPLAMLREFYAEL